MAIGEIFLFSVRAQHVTESHTEDICRVFTGEDYNQTIQSSKKSLRKSVWSATYGKIKIGNSQKNFEWFSPLSSRENANEKQWEMISYPSDWQTVWEFKFGNYQGYEVRGILTHCQWEFKWVQVFWTEFDAVVQLEAVPTAPQHFCFCEHCRPWAQGPGLGPSQQPVGEQQSPECDPNVSSVDKVTNGLRRVPSRWQLK